MIRTPLKSKNPSKAEIIRPLNRAAPVKGWNTRDPISRMDPMYARVMDNWWCTPREVTLRKGAADHVTGFSQTVKTVMPWNGPTSSKIFAATDAGIYDATVAGAVGSSLSTITNGACQYVDFTTSGSSYLLLCNGFDSLRYYDGSAFTTVASFSISGGGTFTTTDAININVFKRRLFFIAKNSCDFYFLPIDSIGGTVSKFPLGGLFGKGGYLVAMGTWTIDGGEGVDDYAVFVTSEGQVAIYKGTDPSFESTWSLQGVYDIGQPLGRKCFIKYGGDLLLITWAGLYPLSKTFQSTNVVVKTPLSDAIGPTFRTSAASYGSNYGWQLAILEQESLLILNVPTAQFTDAEQYAMNLITGAWTRFTGWKATCWERLGNQLYMGVGTKVVKAWAGTADYNGSFTAVVKGAFDYLAGVGGKHMKLVRPILTIQGTVNVGMGLDTDFQTSDSYDATSFASGSSASNFDTALWVANNASGPAVWAGAPTPQLAWQTLGGMPFTCAAPRLRIVAQSATVSWSATDFAFEMGGLLA